MTSTYILTLNISKPPPNLKIGYMIANIYTQYIYPIPSIATTAKSLGTTKVGAQERKYVKNVESMVLTTQNSPANNLNMLIAMEITLLTRDSVQHGKEILKKKIHSRHPFSRG